MKVWNKNGHVSLFHERLADFVVDARKLCKSNAQTASLLGISRPTLLKYEKLAEKVAIARLDPDFQAQRLETFEEWQAWHEHELVLELENLRFFVPFLQALLKCYKEQINMARPSRTGLCAND